MTPSTISIATSAEDHRLARMAALAIGLAMVEAAIPSPLPGVKPGLANIVTLLVWRTHGWGDAAWVSLLRVVAASLLFGTFLSPTFVLSLVGAVCSLAALALTSLLPARHFGFVTHSVLGSFAHIGGQFLVAYLWLIPHAGLFYLTPVFAAAALAFGLVNGLVAETLLERVPDSKTPAPGGAMA